MLSLIGEKRFYPTFWTQFFGAFNDNVFKNALVILITFRSFSLAGFSTELMVTLCSGVFILPFFLFSAFAGEICDRYSKSQLTYYIKLAEVLIMIVGAIGFFSENLLLLMTVLFLMGTQSTFYGPIKYSILPELVVEERITSANAAIEMGTFLAILLGTILGGSLISLGAIGTKLTALAVILFAIIGLLFSRKIPSLKAIGTNKVSFNFIKQNVEILKVSRQNKHIFTAILTISWFWFFGAILLSVFPVYVKNILVSDAVVATVFLALFSIGIAIGSFVCERISGTHLEKGLLTFGGFGMSLFCIDLYLASLHFSSGEATFAANFQSARVLFDLLGLSAAAGIFIVPLYTILQVHAEPSSRSRVIAGNNIVNAFFMVTGSLLLGVFYSTGYKSHEVYLVLGVTNLLVTYLVYKRYSEHFWRLFCQFSAKFFYKFEFTGEENIPKDGPVILICNHVTYIDWLYIAAATKREPRFVMWYVFFKMPVIDIFFKGAKAIPIAGFKESKKVMAQAFDKIALELDKGSCVAYFPEGEISWQEEMTYFRPGLKKIIEKNNVAIVPMHLEGLWGSFFSRKGGKACSSFKALFSEFRRPVKLRIGKPFEFSTLKECEENVKKCQKISL